MTESGTENLDPNDPWNFPISAGIDLTFDKNGISQIQVTPAKSNQAPTQYGEGENAKEVISIKDWVKQNGDPEITVKAVIKYTDGTEMEVGDTRYYPYGNSGVMWVPVSGGTFWHIYKDQDPGNLQNIASINIDIYADGKKLTNVLGDFKLEHKWGTCPENDPACMKIVGKDNSNQKYTFNADVKFSANSNN